MAMEALTLVANPGSASRKYALFAGEKCLARAHFEYMGDRIVCTLRVGDDEQQSDVDVSNMAEVSSQLVPLFKERGLLSSGSKIERIGLRVVAPTSFFLRDHVMSDEVVRRLEDVQDRAPLHVAATLEELKRLRIVSPSSKIVGVSDSAFHATKPERAWNYGLPIHDADRLEIKRFGYHGLSAAATVHILRSAEKLAAKLIICHLGSGASVTAVHHGKSIDTTMGYSPLEGLVMATRVGTIDATAVQVLKHSLSLDDTQLDDYLNMHSGLLGLSGNSSDIRDLLRAEKKGDRLATLALETYVYGVQKAIGQMGAALGGVDMLVFTGTVGERSAVLRQRIMQSFRYLDFLLDLRVNDQCTSPSEPTCVSQLAHSRPVYVVPTVEAAEIARRVLSVE